MTSTVAVPQANKKGNNLPSMLTRTHKIDHCQVWLTAGDSTSISEISSPSLIKRCTQFNELFHPRIHATEKQRWKQFAPNRFENSHTQLSSSFKPFGSRIWNPRENASEKYFTFISKIQGSNKIFKFLFRPVYLLNQGEEVVGIGGRIFWPWVTACHSQSFNSRIVENVAMLKAI